MGMPLGDSAADLDGATLGQVDRTLLRIVDL